MFSIANTFAFLDNSSLNWKNIIVGVSVGQYVFEQYLTYRQYQVLKKSEVPASLKSEVTSETFSKSQEYSRAKARFSVFSSTFGLIQSLLIIKYDILPLTWSFAGDLMKRLVPILPKFTGGVITQSIFYMLTHSVVSTLVSLPLGYYQTFVLEEKFGFNKSNLTLWVTDTLKSLALTFVLVPPILGGFLKIIYHYGDSFILYTCAFVLFVQLAVVTLYPTVIQPLFNKFTPLEDGELKTAIEKLAGECSFPLNKLYVIDGSKRSGHSNAYFTGLPWSKQIVLFDTLIEQATVPETVAVLAHEIGHWKLSHIPQMLVVSQAQLFLLFSFFSAFIKNNSLYHSFGFHQELPVIVGFFLFSDIYKPLESATQFFQNLFIRRNEYQADEYAQKCGYTEDLATSLIKINIENLSSFDADWLYSAYHYSHPLLTERLSAIGYVSKKKVTKEE